MDTIESIKQIRNIEESVVTIGKFDGVHKGHQTLVRKTVDFAKKNKVKSVIFTFGNHPVNYFYPNRIKNIISNKDKIEIFRKSDIDVVIMIPFDEEMTKISANDFVKNILVDKLHAKKIIVGHDFSFAKNKEGNADVLKSLSSEYNFEVEVVQPIKINGTRISSSYIRDLILNGNIEDIREFLGDNYKLSGKVVSSKQLGRKIGFPTANIEVRKDMLIPKNGIYATKVYVGDKVYFGATNIGYNPTVEGKCLSVETNILQFNKEIYGEVIKIEFLERLRDEKKFSSIDELKNQLKFDTNYIKTNYICKKNINMLK